MNQGIKASKTIGANIRHFREERHYTQEAFAAKLQCHGCDISRSTLAKIEAGIRHLSVDEIETIRMLLVMDYADFFIKEPCEAIQGAS